MIRITSCVCRELFFISAAWHTDYCPSAEFCQTGMKPTISEMIACVCVMMYLPAYLYRDARAACPLEDIQATVVQSEPVTLMLDDPNGGNGGDVQLPALQLFDCLHAAKQSVLR